MYFIKFIKKVDSARMPGGLNDVLAVLLMAAKADVPVCPHAGGVGLCEMVQHIQVCFIKLMSVNFASFHYCY